MKSKVSVKGQTVIPREIRDALGITNETFLDWRLEDGAVVVFPIPADPVRASLGALVGKGTFDQYMEERRRELEREGLES